MKVKLQQQKEMFQSHKDMKVSSRNKAPLGNSESSFECESSGQIQLVEDIKRALQMGGNQCLERFSSFGDNIEAQNAFAS